MGSRESVITFASTDFFLRHIDRKRFVDSDETISADVFKPRERETGLSFTHQGPLLCHPDSIAAYQMAKRLPSGDLPGICRLTWDDLSNKLDPPLPPRPAPINEDPVYGDLHCLTDCPRDEIHRDRMAKLATKHGLLLRFKVARKTSR